MAKLNLLRQKALGAALIFLSTMLLAANVQAQRNLAISAATSSQQHIGISKTEKRTALVIGNNAYKEVPLTASVNDARAMASALRELNFDVVEIEDAGRLVMLRAIRKLADDLGKADTVGLFYFAGHGVQSKGKNFLVPIDAEIEHEDDIEQQSVDVQYLLDKFADIRNGMNILILDACRNNPFARRNVKRPSGLAAVDGPPGTLVAFAAAPGQVAAETTNGNGVYTRNVLKNIRVPGLPVEEIFKRVRAGVLQDTNERQVPWENTSLVRDFYFTAAQAGQGFKPAVIDTEANDWAQVENSKNIYEFIGFLRRFPKTRYQAELLAKVNVILAKLKPAPPSLLVSELPSLLLETTGGLQLRSLNKFSAEHFGMTTHGGVLVSGVERGAAAARAGILPGDIILRLNDRPTNSVDEVMTLARTIVPGEQVDVVAWRGRKELEFSAIAQRAPIERLLGNIASDHLRQKNFGRAFEYFRYMASIDDAQGEFGLGSLYLRGLGVTKDIKQSEYWFSKAAMQGHTLSAAYLAQIYLSPSAGVSNDSEAFRNAMVAAEAGVPEGAAMLAIAYRRGVGTTANQVESVKWSRFAAELGNPSGMFLLGLAYEAGIGGLARNPENAKMWLRRARDLNFEPAKVALDRLGE